MSEIHVQRLEKIIEDRFILVLDMSDTSDANRGEARKAALSRGLAAFAVACLTGADHVEAAASIAGGRFLDAVGGLEQCP